jgi:S-adenosylmethionine hydrolase
VRAVEISSPDAMLAPISATFHGRDVFAPAAAHLARGAALESLGPSVPVESLETVEVPQPEAERGWVRCRVLGVDRFGNVQLSLRPEDLVELGGNGRPNVIVSLGGQELPLRRASTFGELEPGEDGLIVDSAGALAIVRNGESAAEALDLGPGDDILVKGRNGSGGLNGG